MSGKMLLYWLGASVIPMIICLPIMAAIARPTYKQSIIVIAVAFVTTYLMVAILGSYFLGPIAAAIGCGFILRHVFQSRR